MECYLDNSATTKPCREAVAAATKMMTETFGNPSSLHATGYAALQALEEARATLAKPLKAQSEEIFFTPCGTVSNNTAIFGAAQFGKQQHRGNKIITTAMEHPSVLQCMARLEEEGFEVVCLEPDANGQVSLDALEQAVDKNTILVSMMAVNNEVGSILPFERVKAILEAKQAPALLHVDAVQAFLKLPIVPKKCGIDLLSASAHKVHGLKGSGILYVRKGLSIRPYLLGGGQENGMCSGTQAMPNIAAFAAATKAFGKSAQNADHVAEVKETLLEALDGVEGIAVNSPQNALPYILNLSIAGIPSQVSVNFLSSKGVSVSAGSACSKGHRSAVLEAMGLSPQRIDTAIRISFSHLSTKEEALYCAKMIEEEIQQLRKKG